MGASDLSTGELLRQYKFLNRLVPGMIVVVVGFYVFTGVMDEDPTFGHFLVVPMFFLYMYRWYVWIVLKKRGAVV